MGSAFLKVRAAVPGDAAAIARIYVDSWNAGFAHLIGHKTARPGEVERWRAEIARADQQWWVAERHGIVVGVAGTGESRDPVRPGLGELDTIAVAPSEWRTGVGRALMQIALRHLGERYDAAILWTVAGYEQGRAFYEANGWVADRAGRAGGTEIRFRHDLRAVTPPG